MCFFISVLFLGDVDLRISNSGGCGLLDCVAVFFCVVVSSLDIQLMTCGQEIACLMIFFRGENIAGSMSFSGG